MCFQIQKPDPPPYKRWSICRDLSCKIRVFALREKGPYGPPQPPHRGPKMGALGADRRGPEMTRLLVPARSTSVQASSPSSQVKAAAGQVGDRNWKWEKNLVSDYRGGIYQGTIG